MKYAESYLKAVQLEVLGIPIELRFSDKACLPLSSELKIFQSWGLLCTAAPTTIKFVDTCFDGLTQQEYLGQRRQSISMVNRGSDLLFSFFTGQFLASPDFRKIQLWSPFEQDMSIARDGYANYNGDPTLRLILWGRASFERFCYVHGALVVLDGRYVLLMGDSGAGKSTLAGYACLNGGTCLTEEDPFISWDDQRPFVHATPWPGIRGEMVPASGPLAAIFFLSHGRQNKLRELAPGEKSRRLLHCARTFNWLPETIPDALELIDKAAKNVPAYDFGFVPDHSAVDAICNVL